MGTDYDCGLTEKRVCAAGNTIDGGKRLGTGIIDTVSSTGSNPVGLYS